QAAPAGAPGGRAPGRAGEGEPLRTLGVLLSEEAVKLKAVELGIASSTKELTEAQKVQARYAPIPEQTRTPQGDSPRPSTGLANAMRVIRAAFGDIQAQLGQAVLPTIARLAQLLVGQLPAITAAVQQFAAQVAAILEQVFSGDISGGLAQVAERLGPVLATWSQAFWDWLATMTPELLRRLSDL